MASQSRIQLENWVKEIEINSCNVLDIGGSQLPVKKRAKLGNDVYYKIMDLENPHENSEKPDIVWDINEDIEKGHPNEMNNWDNVFMLEVTEYLWNPVQAFKNVNKLLRKKGGHVYASFHFIYPVHNPKEEDTLRYTENGVKRILEKTGFEIVDLTHREMRYRDILHSWHTAEGMRPSRDYNNHKSVGCLVKARKLI